MQISLNTILVHTPQKIILPKIAYFLKIYYCRVHYFWTQYCSHIMSLSYDVAAGTN